VTRGWLVFGRLGGVGEMEAKLVLNGANTFDQDLFRECVRDGVSKVNAKKQVIDWWKGAMLHRESFTPITEESIGIFQKDIEKLMDEWRILANR
jgi:hypothetical protein